MQTTTPPVEAGLSWSQSTRPDTSRRVGPRPPSSSLSSGSVRSLRPLAAAYGSDFDEHRAHLESELVRLAGAGRAGLGLLPGTVAGLTAFAGGDGDPADPKTRAGYANRIAGGTGRVPWPPERNEACWCGSGLKYKKCCLPRSRR